MFHILYVTTYLHICVLKTPDPYIYRQLDQFGRSKQCDMSKHEKSWVFIVATSQLANFSLNSAYSSPTSRWKLQTIC